MPHTHSFTYHPRCIMFSSQHFSFPCQYHSTNAPYSCILHWRYVILGTNGIVKTPLFLSLSFTVCLSLSLRLSLTRTTALICCVPIFIDSTEGECKLCSVMQSVCCAVNVQSYVWELVETTVMPRYGGEGCGGERSVAITTKHVAKL